MAGDRHIAKRQVLTGDNMPRKPQNPQKQDASNVSQRDCFETPRYATEIIIPFLKKEKVEVVWECACGPGRMSRVLGGEFLCTSSDLSSFNFVSDEFRAKMFDWTLETAIVTNPPFSLKFQFIERALKLGFPFAFLIPADYCGRIGKYMMMGCEKVVPTRRIDYLTPNMLTRINEGTGRGYKILEDVPTDILRKYSSSYFHSMWLTKGLNIGNSETWVELTNDDKNRIF